MTIIQQVFSREQIKLMAYILSIHTGDAIAGEDILQVDSRTESGIIKFSLADKQTVNLTLARWQQMKIWASAQIAA